MKKLTLTLASLFLFVLTSNADIVVTTTKPVEVAVSPVVEQTNTPALKLFLYNAEKVEGDSEGQIRIKIGLNPENYTVKEFKAAAVAQGIDLRVLEGMVSKIYNQMIETREAANPTPTP
jgi:hypothetical protein